ncbi:Uncharacterized protein TCM_021687 [Theobroma cacao]|uniref:Uncharacterized protein n=1 Tax=Theobroma cacao TaxID=3641 RepID=A0A061ERD6_THECC|nr:Uncharacterized protein TCM_021687 [Theobroma cacao]
MEGRYNVTTRRQACVTHCLLSLKLLTVLSRHQLWTKISPFHACSFTQVSGHLSFKPNGQYATMAIGMAGGCAHVCCLFVSA